MHELPTPDPVSREHSDKVVAHLIEQIEAADGFLPFADYMHECLYAPGLGYYAAGSRKFGEAGDFVTAPELSPLFGRLVANQVAPLCDALDRFEIVELGAGTGQLALHLLRRLEELDRLPGRYAILEVSPDLKERQRALLNSELPQLIDRIDWVSAIPTGTKGVILANEVLDALPVERFRIERADVQQIGVTNTEGRLEFTDRRAPDALTAAVREIERERGTPFDDGYVSDVCLAATPWVRSLVESIERGLVVFFDYGTERKTYYANNRDDGWLRCHFRHRAHNDALLYPGIQDLTCWVDFTRVAEAAVSAGAHVGGYVSQAHFLLNAGIEKELQAIGDAPERERARVTSAVRTLMMPGDMGEHVKCIGFVKDCPTPDALRQMDRTHTL